MIDRRSIITCRRRLLRWPPLILMLITLLLLTPAAVCEDVMDRADNSDTDSLGDLFWNAVPRPLSNLVSLSNISTFDYQPWFWSILASGIIGLSGVLPILVIPIEAGASLKQGAAAKTLRLLLSFAVGGLLGDVFLHLLPEAWHHMGSANEHSGHITIGLWVLAGVFVFIVVEMMFEKADENIVESASVDSPRTFTPNSNGLNGIHHVSSAKSNSKSSKKHSGSYKNGHVRKISSHARNGCASHLSPSFKSDESHNSRAELQPSDSRNVAGYLNLLANSIDNFTHGLAVAGSFLVSFKVGMLTTFAILIHEVPHEIGDFAILLKSGFSRCDAAKAQMATASVGLAGALAALSAESAQSLGERTAWILPFTAGGFLNIALVNVLPDILQEKDPRESVKQLGCIIAGIGVMGLVTVFFG